MNNQNIIRSMRLRVFFQCTGVGVMNRGIESFFREAFDGLKSAPGIEATLIKGSGVGKDDEIVARCLPRTGVSAGLIGRISGRTSYAVEQWSSFFHVVHLIRKRRPQLIFYSDANLGFLLYRFRRWIGVPFVLLYSNGGPCHPPFVRVDYVHQVAPFYLDEALRYGEDPNRHVLVPYGVTVPDPIILAGDKQALRRELGLPLNRKILLSVGHISRDHKRMDYVIEEVAKMPEPRPFLQLLGAIDGNSPEVIESAIRLLGANNVSVRSVAYEAVGKYYQAADCFVLASLQEGFGRVFLEALLHGLPTIGHCHPVIEYVLGDVGIVADLREAGALTRILAGVLSVSEGDQEKRRRYESVRERFGWQRLAPDYMNMFRACSQTL